MSDQTEVAIARAMSTASRSGAETSEFQAAKSSGFWGIVAMILGILVSVAPPILDALGAQIGESSTFITVAGTVVAVAGIIQKALVDAGYIKARKETKIAVSNAAESLGG